MPARILIIEDNPANLELMSYLLTAFGHVALGAKDGEEGLATARGSAPDLILCDLQLPGMDGHAVVREIKADPALRAIPLVAVTAFAMVGDRDKVLASGFDGYVAKPIDPETFVAHVETFVPPDQRSSRTASVATPPDASSVKAKRATILAVDDQPVNLSLERSILEPMGYAVVTANDLAQGLELARQTPPDLILSDVMMASGNGYDFIKAVKSEPALKHIPFIFLTSTCCDQASRAKALALGAERFLFRPLEPQELLAQIAACLSERKKT
jgi:CheY-like chemotaxis protein